MNKPYSLLISFPLATHSTGTGTPNLPGDYWSDFALDRAFIPVFEDGRTQRECVYQNESIEAGEKASFLSLLLPHSRNRGADEMAGEIDVVSADDESCCVRVGRAVLLFNDGDTISNDIVETDARQLYIEETGNDIFAAYRGARTIVFRGRELLRTGEAVDGELKHPEV